LLYIVSLLEILGIKKDTSVSIKARKDSVSIVGVVVLHSLSTVYRWRYM